MSKGSISTSQGALNASLVSGTSRIVLVLSLYTLLVTILFHGTVLSMVATWLNSDTYTHSFVIPPLAVFLAWRLRGHFSTSQVRPEPRVLILTLGAGMVWLLANLVDINVVQQLAYVAVLVSGIWAIVGTAIARRCAFPLGFLFLAVPMGSGLIPPLMEFTADTTEYLLRASSVPVLREGMFLFLPTGTWSVVEECSGVNYVIASVTLGLCYAHLNYASLWRQAAFVLAAIITPVVANSLRAYAVVLAGHLSNMRIGTGDDHIVFGWIFFGLVMLLMFWVGSFWQQSEAEPPAPRQDFITKSLPAGVLIKALGFALLSASLWPALSAAINRADDPVESIALTVPEAQSPWRTVDSSGWRWRPLLRGADRELDQVYAIRTGSETVVVGLHLRQYLQQDLQGELVDTSISPWRTETGDWEVMEQQRLQSNLDVPQQVFEFRVTSGRDELLIWSWYRIDNQHSANSYLVKILEAKQQLFQGHRRGSRIIVATPLNGDKTQARQNLREFVAEHRAAIESSLDAIIAEQTALPNLASLRRETAE